MAKPIIVTRAGKGSALTWTEGDANFTNLQNATFTITDGIGSVTNDLNSSLTIVPGANITLTFNDTSKSLTIDATAEDARVICYNNTGTLIPKGSVVYISGSQGAHSTIALARADAENTSAGTIGIVYADISDATTGYVQTGGVVKGVNTLGLIEGNLLYLSPTTAGAFTQTKPSAPNHVVTLGWLIAASSTAGRIQVKVDNGYELSELHNVSNATPNDNDVLKYVVSTGLWTPSASTGGGDVVSDLTPQLGGDLDVNGKSIVSVSNGNIMIAPNGSGNILLTPATGHITLGMHNWPTSDGTSGQVLQTNGSGTLSWVTSSGGLTDVVNDTTPQLGGDLDVNGKSIVSVSNGNIMIAPNGSGNILLTPATGHITLGMHNWPTSDGTSGQVLQTNGSGTLSWVTSSGGLTDIVNDTTPQLGGDLDVNGKSIVSVSNGNIMIVPNGSGNVMITPATGHITLGMHNWPTSDGTNGQVLQTNGSGTLSWSTPSVDLTSPGPIGSTTPNTIASTSLAFKYTVEPVYDLGTTGGTIAPNAANGSVQKITLNSALTINAFTSPIAGQSVTLIIYGGTAYTSITSTMKFSGGVKTLTATAGCIDIVTIYYDGTNYLASLGKGFA